MIGLALAGAVGAAVFRVHEYHRRAASLVSLGGGRRHYADGRDVEIMIAGNANDRSAVVVVLHYGTIDPRRNYGVLGRVYSSNDPIEGLLSACRVDTSYPPDPVESGVWVDGKRRSVSDRLTVIYISDQVPATDIGVGEGEQDSFLNDARRSDPLQFIEKWIQPRLAKAATRP